MNRFQVLVVGFFALMLAASNGGPVGAVPFSIPNRPGWTLSAVERRVDLYLIRPTKAVAVEPGVTGSGKLAVVISCDAQSLLVQTRELVPARQFPQPKLVLRIGTVDQSAQPDAKMVGKEAVLEAEFPVSTSVMTTKAAMKALETGATINFVFQSQFRKYSIPDVDLRTSFVSKCLSLWDLPG